MALTYFGVSTFTQIAPARWSLSDHGLDTLIVPMDGPASGLEAYLTTLVKWHASAIDPDMFFSRASTDDAKRYPGVELIYIGCRGGITDGRQKTDTDDSLQTANYSSGSTAAELTYLAPTATRSEIGRTQFRPQPPVIDTTTDPTFVMGRNTGLVLTPETIFALFLKVSAPSYASDELVPDQYYRNMATSTLILQPLSL